MSCRNCNSTGSVTIDNEFVSRPITMMCWICSGTSLKGLDRKQQAWYLAQYRALEKFQKHVAKESFDKAGWETFKGLVNKACVKLGIALLPVRYPRATGFGQDQAVLNLKADLKEYERRLTAIPLKTAERVAA